MPTNLTMGEILAGPIPPIFTPELPADVIDYAYALATESLATNDWGDDWPALYRHVRACMNRRAVCDLPGTLDDDAISEGIVRAINAR